MDFKVNDFQAMMQANMDAWFKMVDTNMDLLAKSVATAKEQTQRVADMYKL